MRDVLIIGGGIIGLSLARELKRKGFQKITILEKNSMCGAEASSAAAGMLAPQAEADCADDFFRFCAESRNLYENFAAEFFDESGVNIELDKTGTLYLAFNERDANELEKRFEWQKAANLQVEKLSREDVLKLEPNVSPKVLFGLSFPLDWQVENRKILEALNISFDGKFIHGEAKRLILENGKIIGVETDKGNYFAPIVIICSGAWTSLIMDEFDLLSSLKIKPIRGQMLAFNDYFERLCKHVIYTRRGYAVPRKDLRVLFGATTEDVGFESRTTAAEIASLMQNAFEISPEFERLSLKKTWSGLRPFCADGLPILGEFSDIENLVVATAHYRNGILLAPLTAKILAEKIAENKDSEYLKIFSPQRFLQAKSSESRL